MAAASPLLVMIDALLLLIPVGVFVVARPELGNSWPDVKRFSRGFVLVAALAIFDLGVFAGHYLGGQVLEVGAILGGTAIAVAAVALAGRSTRLIGWVRDRRRILANVALAVGAIALLFAVFVRPACCPGRFESSPALEATRKELGEPADGTRSYAE